MSISTLIAWFLKNSLPFLAGVLLTSFFDFYLKRPKLIVAGSGGGGGAVSIPGVTKKYVHIKNNPGLFGIVLGETQILGKRLFRRKDFGVIFDRNPAHECRAHLIDKSSKQIISPLAWEQNGVISQDVTLNSGEGANLVIFARQNNELLKYFPYRIANFSTGEILIPSDELKFDTDKEFVVEVSYQYGRRKISFDLEVKKELMHGRLAVYGSGGGGTF